MCAHSSMKQLDIKVINDTINFIKHKKDIPWIENLRFVQRRCLILMRHQFRWSNIYFYDRCMSTFGAICIGLQFGPEKYGTGYFPQCVDAITGILAVYEVTSREKIYAKVGNFGSIDCFL